MIVKVVALASLLLLIYSIITVLYCATRQPMNQKHEMEISKHQAKWTVLMVLASLFFGLAIESLLP